MRAILIDPEQRSITEIEYDNSDYKNICKLIDATLFDVARFADTRDAVYVDDNGLSANKRFFHLDGMATPLAGKGLVLGTDYQGESIEPEATVEGLEKVVMFLSDTWPREQMLWQWKTNLRMSSTSR